MGCCNNNSKKSNAEVIEGMLCYCFCFSEDDLQNAINQKQENDFIKEINNQIRSLGCNCEKLNPSGKCCIPTIKKLIESKNMVVFDESPFYMCPKLGSQSNC